jgi:hypothetical protein
LLLNLVKKIMKNTMQKVKKMLRKFDIDVEMSLGKFIVLGILLVVVIGIFVFMVYSSSGAKGSKASCDGPTITMMENQGKSFAYLAVSGLKEGQKLFGYFIAFDCGDDCQSAYSWEEFQQTADIRGGLPKNVVAKYAHVPGDGWTSGYSGSLNTTQLFRVRKTSSDQSYPNVTGEPKLYVMESGNNVEDDLVGFQEIEACFVNLDGQSGGSGNDQQGNGQSDDEVSVTNNCPNGLSDEYVGWTVNCNVSCGSAEDCAVSLSDKGVVQCYNFSEGGRCIYKEKEGGSQSGSGSGQTGNGGDSSLFVSQTEQSSLQPSESNPAGVGSCPAVAVQDYAVTQNDWGAICGMSCQTNDDCLAQIQSSFGVTVPDPGLVWCYGFGNADTTGSDSQCLVHSSVLPIGTGGTGANAGSDQGASGQTGGGQDNDSQSGSGQGASGGSQSGVNSNLPQNCIHGKPYLDESNDKCICTNNVDDWHEVDRSACQMVEGRLGLGDTDGTEDVAGICSKETGHRHFRGCYDDAAQGVKVAVCGDRPYNQDCDGQSCGLGFITSNQDANLVNNMCSIDLNQYYQGEDSSQSSQETQVEPNDQNKEEPQNGGDQSSSATQGSCPDGQVQCTNENAGDICDKSWCGNKGVAGCCEQ